MSLATRVAYVEDLPAILEIEEAVMGHGQARSEQISEAVNEARCLVTLSHSTVQGFAIYRHSFFRRMDFLELIMTRPLYRRRGAATSLITHFLEISETKERWTSTNQSNIAMVSLLERLGWQMSSHSEDLDPGDPELFFFNLRSIR